MNNKKHWAQQQKNNCISSKLNIKLTNHTLKQKEMFLAREEVHTKIISLPSKGNISIGKKDAFFTLFSDNLTKI